MMVEFSKGKFWYDLTDHEFHAKDMDDDRFKTIVKALKKRL